jgi:hypothetical protein
MFRYTSKTGRLFGIPFKIDASWLLILCGSPGAWGSYIPDPHPELSAVATWLLAA